MARDINSVFIIGRLVKDPEIRYTPSGTPVSKFSIANNSSFMQNKEVKETVNYFDITVWGNQAVNCEKYLKKGRQVAITGSLKQNRWVDKTSGQNRSKIEITALNVQYLSSGGEGGASNFGMSSKEKMDRSEKTEKTEKTDKTNYKPNEEVYEDPWGNSSDEQAFDEANPFNESGDDDIPF